MTDISPASTTLSSARINRSFFRRAVGVCVVIIAGVLTMNVLEKALHLTFDKPPMPLTKPLDQLKLQLGNPLRYMAGNDERLDGDTIETLGTNKYLVRHYTDLTKANGEVGRELVLNLNYYDQGSSNPHVPEICWVGNGNVESLNSRKVFVVDDVPHKNKTVSPIRMTMISFLPSQNELTTIGNFGDDVNSHLKNVAYCFEVNGKYVASPGEVMSDFWRASYKYAYDTKIEVTVEGFSNQEEAQKAIGDFLRTALPEIEECLPNPALLTDNPAPLSSGNAENVNDKSSNPK